MRTRDDVLSFFNKELKRKSRRGKFGLTKGKSSMAGIHKGTLLVFTYQTECMFIARAASDIVRDADPEFPAYFVVDVDSITAVNAPLQDYERALKKKGLLKKHLVRSQAWPELSDACEVFTLSYFNYPSLRPAMGTTEPVEQSLHDAMLALYRQAGKETGYWGNYYLRSVKRHGGLATAKRMLRPKENDKIDKGLQALIDAGRAHELSVEAIVLRPEFRALFTEEELAEAARRIEKLPHANAPELPSPKLEKKVKRLRRNGVSTPPEGQAAPEGVEVTTVQFKRDPAVKAWVLESAQGICELCDKAAPFNDDDGVGFLEVHHVRFLGDGGSDKITNAVALCPNCHRACHLSSERKQYLASLYERRSRLIRE